jgi:CheY-like chemotaxis protein
MTYRSAAPLLRARLPPVAPQDGEIAGDVVMRPQHFLVRVPGIEPPLVLLVEDFKDVRDVYRAGLERDGFRVVVASDTLEAIEVVYTERVDLILMAGALPSNRRFGWAGDAVNTLKAVPGLSRVPVLMFAGHWLHVDAREASLAAGADGFIRLPCLPAVFTQQSLAALAHVGDARVRVIDAPAHAD